MRTEMRYGERVWTKESIDNILDCYHNDRHPSYVHETITSLLSDSLQEAGFTETIKQDQLNAWSLVLDNWSCYIKFIRPVDGGGGLILIGLEQYDIGDLIYLWDKIRDRWRTRIKQDCPKRP